MQYMHKKQEDTVLFAKQKYEFVYLTCSITKRANRREPINLVLGTDYYCLTDLASNWRL